MDLDRSDDDDDDDDDNNYYYNWKSTSNWWASQEFTRVLWKYGSLPYSQKYL